MWDKPKDLCIDNRVAMKRFHNSRSYQSHGKEEEEEEGVDADKVFVLIM